MRNFRPALGVLAVLLVVVFAADCEAGRRCRPQRCGNDCCASPCWIDCCSYTFPPPGYECQCCQNMHPTVPCPPDTSQCDSGTVCYVLSTFTIDCGGRPASPTPPGRPCDVLPTFTIGCGGPGCARPGCAMVMYYPMYANPHNDYK